MSGTKADGDVGGNRYLGTINSDRSSNVWNVGDVWTRRHWLARLTICLVAMDKIGGVFF